MLIGLLIAFGMTARAELKTCEIKGMVCQGCVDMVTKGLCGEAYSNCSVRLKSKAKKLGEVTWETKDPNAKVDVADAARKLDVMSYALATCTTDKASAKR